MALYAAKDILDTAGITTGWGAEPFANRVPEIDAEVICRLTAAGGVLIGKTSVGALAFGDIWYGGQTPNPWNTEEGSRGLAPAQQRPQLPAWRGSRLERRRWARELLPAPDAAQWACVRHLAECPVLGRCLSAGPSTKSARSVGRSTMPHWFWRRSTVSTRGTCRALKRPSVGTRHAPRLVCASVTLPSILQTRSILPCWTGCGAWGQRRSR